MAILASLQLHKSGPHCCAWDLWTSVPSGPAMREARRFCAARSALIGRANRRSRLNQGQVSSTVRRTTQCRPIDSVSCSQKTDYEEMLVFTVRTRLERCVHKRLRCDAERLTDLDEIKKAAVVASSKSKPTVLEIGISTQIPSLI